MMNQQDRIQRRKQLEETYEKVINELPKTMKKQYYIPKVADPLPPISRRPENYFKKNVLDRVSYCFGGQEETFSFIQNQTYKLLKDVGMGSKSHQSLIQASSNIAQLCSLEKDLIKLNLPKIHERDQSFNGRYHQQKGFVIRWDQLQPINSSIKKIRISHGIFVKGGKPLVTTNFGVNKPIELDNYLSKQCKIEQRSIFNDVKPNRNLVLYIELRCWTTNKKLPTIVAWTMHEPFNQRGELDEGFFRLPFYSMQISPIQLLMKHKKVPILILLEETQLFFRICIPDNPKLDVDKFNKKINSASGKFNNFDYNEANSFQTAEQHKMLIRQFQLPKMHVNRSDNIVSVDQEMQPPLNASPDNKDELQPWDPDNVDDEQLKEIYKQQERDQEDNDDQNYEESNQDQLAKLINQKNQRQVQKLQEDQQQLEEEVEYDDDQDDYQEIIDQLQEKKKDNVKYNREDSPKINKKPKNKKQADNVADGESEDSFLQEFIQQSEKKQAEDPQAKKIREQKDKLRKKNQDEDERRKQKKQYPQIKTKIAPNDEQHEAVYKSNQKTGNEEGKKKKKAPKEEEPPDQNFLFISLLKLTNFTAPSTIANQLGGLHYSVKIYTQNEENILLEQSGNPCQLFGFLRIKEKQKQALVFDQQCFFNLSRKFLLSQKQKKDLQLAVEVFDYKKDSKLPEDQVYQLGSITMPLFLDKDSLNLGTFENQILLQHSGGVEGQKQNTKIDQKQSELSLSFQLEHKIPEFLNKEFNEKKKIQVQIISLQNVKDPNLLLKYQIELVNDCGVINNYKDNNQLISKCNQTIKPQKKGASSVKVDHTHIFNINSERIGDIYGKNLLNFYAHFLFYNAKDDNDININQDLSNSVQSPDVNQEEAKNQGQSEDKVVAWFYFPLFKAKKPDSYQYNSGKFTEQLYQPPELSILPLQTKNVKKLPLKIEIQLLEVDQQ